MKKFILLLTLISLPLLGFAQKGKDAAQKNTKCIEAQVILDDVKLYRQAGTCTEVLTSLKTTDEVLFHRKQGDHWALVTVGDQVGYVLYGELTNRAPAAKPAIALALDRKKK